MKNQLKVCCYCLLLSIFVGCSSVAVKTLEIGNRSNCKNKILIATQSSEFKNSVVAEMEKSLKIDSIYIKKIDVSNLMKEAAEQYDVVAIISSFKMKSLDGEVKHFLDKPMDKTKLVMLITAGTPSIVGKIEGVDAISSASKLTKSRSIAEELVVKVKHHLASN